MSQYTKSTNFATKDNLPTGDPLKIVKGTEIDTEYNNIATAIATKTDNSAAAITGGTITGITDLAVADGGTGASTATAALNNLLPSQTGNSSKYLQTDGTNATWDAVSLSTSDITGTLPIANGGTGTTSTTFANLTTNVTGTLPVANGGTGVTSSTGTGNVVLSNSPTLVTPALGTPASGVATNLTGLPLSTGITGLGTGVATALAINTPNTGAMVVNGGALGTPSSGTVTNLTGTASININGQVGSSTPNSGNFTTLSASSTVTISGGTADGVAYLNGSKVLTTGSVLSFSGVHLTSNRNKDTTYSGTDYTTYANGFILNNSATPATGIFNSIYFTNNANMQSVFGVVQNSSGYGDFVWAGNSGSYAEWMRLSSSGLTLTSNPTLSGGTANGVTYLNGSKVLTSGSALTFNGSTLVSKGTTNGNIVSVGGSGGSHTGYSQFQGYTGNGDSSNINYALVGNKTGSSYLGIPNNGVGLDLVYGTSFSFCFQETEALRLTSTSLYTASGINVGIGLSNPAYKLQVKDGSVGVTSADGTVTSLVNYNSIGTVTNTAFNIVTNSTDRLVVSATGNLGLGVTPSAWLSVIRALQVNNTGMSLFTYTAAGTADQYAFLTNNSYQNSSVQDIYVRTNPAAQYRQFNATHAWYNAPSGTAGNAISFTQAMTLDASGLLQVGTTSPAGGSQITAYGASNGQIAVQNSTNWSRMLQNAGDLYIDNGVGGSAGNIIFRQGSSTTERARIDSSGNLLVGTTSAGGYTPRLRVVSGSTQQGAELQANNSGYYAGLIMNTATSGDNYFLYFGTEANGDSQRGSISYNRTAGLVSFNTTSDYRAKDISGPVTGSGALIDSVPVYMGTMKGATQERPMFIAHETPAYAHTGVKDAVDADGKPVYQQMDASALIPVMWAEIQSLRQRVAQLETN